MRQSIRYALVFVLAGLAALIMTTWQTVAEAQPSSPANTSPSSDLSQPPLSAPSAGLAIKAYPAELPPLPYDYAALEPFVDEATMRLHHDKHHATYVENLNTALQQYPDLQNQTVDILLKSVDTLPDNIRTTVRNNGGGHLNHTLFWSSMTPNAEGAPTGELAEAITQTFGGIDQFKQQFNTAGSGQFGSGWVWLVQNQQGQLEIITTPNQDNPIMNDLYPILGNDVWEHAYYLKYQNRRAEYLNNWWNVVNWAEVDRRWAQANSSNTPQTR